MMRSLVGRIKRKLSRVRTQFFSPPPTTAKQVIRRLRDNPRSLVLWLDLIGLSAPDMPEALRDQIRSHDLSRTGVILGFKDELETLMAADLETAYRRLEGEYAASVCSDVVAEMIRLKTIAQCRDAHAEGNYYRDAEPYMRMQWDGVIWPIIQNLDFQHVLELAPGHGRNTEFLRRLATSITLVDVNSNCIDACRERFGDRVEGCQFRYFVTAGDSLAMVDSESQTLVYSFDSMVHFDSSVVKAYVHEISRVLRPGGSAFLHHSNYGTVAPNSDWAHNPGNRSDMTAERMRAFASEAGLEVTFQRLSGLADGWGLEELDAFSVLRRPAGR
jgi:SAM-dependent methyltransferase